jgi:1-pyrroline-5-carboxylate dehydrogenase
MKFCMQRVLRNTNKYIFFKKYSQNQFNVIINKNFSLKLSDFSEFDVEGKQYKLSNFINGEWRKTAKYEEFPDPLRGGKFMDVPLTEKPEMTDIIQSMRSCPRSGLHNPFKNIDRYLLYGQICRKVAEALHNPEIFNHFVKLIGRVMPKSEHESFKEMKVSRAFFENFSGDNVKKTFLFLG